MGLSESISFRMGKYVERQKRRDIFDRNGLSEQSLSDVPENFIEALETVKNYVSRSTILLDIGAHKGLFSKAANAMFKFDHTILFEPNAAHKPILENRLKSISHEVRNVALSDKAGEEVTFYLHQDDTMNSIIESSNEVLEAEFPYDAPDKMKKTTVKTDTLDESLAEILTKSPVFFLKIDTQGNELNVLQAGRAVLARTEICFIEYMFLSPYKNEFSFQDLVGFMDEQGFDCKGALSISKRPSKKVSAVDFLFVRRSAVSIGSRL